MKLNINKMRLWYKFEGRYLWRNFKLGVKNLIKWFPIVWKDRDWDYSFILRNLKFKLENTANYIESKKRFEGWEFVVRDARLCSKLVDLINEDFYGMEYMDYEEMEYSFIPIPDSDCSELKMDQISDNLDDYFKKYPRQYKKFHHIEDRRKIAHKISYENHYRAKRLLFKILRDRIERFWD